MAGWIVGSAPEHLAAYEVGGVANGPMANAGVTNRAQAFSTT